MSKKKEIQHYQISTYEQYSLFNMDDLLNNTSKFAKPTITYVIARDPNTCKEVLHITL